MTKRTYPAIDAETMSQLRAYAAQEGRKWKHFLETESWWRGMPVRGFPLLYNLRNTHGPSWLHDFRLP